jgi:hypothetical protein
MPLFFAYGTELDRARLLAKTLADPPEQVKREATQSAAGEVTAGAEAAAPTAEPMGPPNPADADTRKSVNAPFFNYATRQPLASGYAVGMSLAFRRRDGDTAESELVPDLCPDAGAKTWGVLFELSDDTLSAICARDAARTCEKLHIDATKLLSGWQSASSDISNLPGRTVEASCLVAKDKSAPSINADDRTLRRMAACYADFDADISDIRALLPATTSSIDSLRKDHTDLAERVVSEIYYKAPPRYAIYRSAERVMVQYADAATLADKQRADMAPLNTLRSQIAGLVDGFDRSWFPSVADRGKRYNAQVAAALNQRLEGDMASPQLTLADIKAAILSERESWGRFQYLLSAFLTAFVICTVFWLVKDHWFKPNHPTAGLWLAARAGTVGAFFSIASNISSGRLPPTSINETTSLTRC